MAKAPAPTPGNCAGNGLTSTSPQRVSAAAQNTTKPARPPANPPMPNIKHPVLTPHTRPAVVTGPTSWENCDSPSTPSGKPPLRGPSSPGWPDSDGDYDGD